jgi:hypothetical protein
LTIIADSFYDYQERAERNLKRLRGETEEPKQEEKKESFIVINAPKAEKKIVSDVISVILNPMPRV